MKKLMFAVAAVALASVATAATTNWSYQPGGALKDGYIRKDSTKTTSDLSVMSGASVYLFDAANVSYGGKTGQTALLLALAAGEDLADYAVKGLVGDKTIAISDTTGADGKVAAAQQTAFSTDAYTVDQVVSFFAAVTAEDAAGNKFVYLSANKDTTALHESQTQGIATALGLSTNYRGDGKEFGSAGWYQYQAGAVPEPTSGLLLLLGVAGLALKRKRA